MKESESKILEELKKMGKITEEDIIAASSNYLDDDFKMAVDLLHNIMCEEKHKGINQASLPGCSYHAEEQLPDGWTWPCHKEWIDTIKKYKRKLEINNNEDFLSCVKGAIQIVEYYNNTTKEVRILARAMIETISDKQLEVLLEGKGD